MSSRTWVTGTPVSRNCSCCAGIAGGQARCARSRSWSSTKWTVGTRSPQSVLTCRMALFAQHHAGAPARRIARTRVPRGPSTRNATGKGEDGPNTIWVARMRAPATSPLRSELARTRRLSASRASRSASARRSWRRTDREARATWRGRSAARPGRYRLVTIFASGCLLQPGFDLSGRLARRLDAGALRHLHLDQHLGPVGDREELLLHRSPSQKTAMKNSPSTATATFLLVDHRHGSRRAQALDNAAYRRSPAWPPSTGFRSGSILTPR